MYIVALFLSIFIFLTHPAIGYDIDLSSEEIIWIAEKIFANECSSRDELLVQWNDGEDFLSLGIGHFIWYPEGKKCPFEEAFPDFLKFAKLTGADIPTWLGKDTSQPCPWPTKEVFLKNQRDKRVIELKVFLESTKPLQAEFIIKCFRNSLPSMIETVSDFEQKRHIEIQVDRLLSTAQGTYALIDYANFKGMGVSPLERYKGEGWGLLQVLSEMRDHEIAPDAVREFSESADRVLTRRVENAPKERNEQRWLAGWHNRVKTYQ